MDAKKKLEQELEQDIARQQRRKFLKKAGAVAAAAPAAALLLSAKSKPAQATGGHNTYWPSR